MPVVVFGDRALAGRNPTPLAELVGFAHDERAAPREELIGFDRAHCDGAIRAFSDVPRGPWERSGPRRPRPVRERAQHVFEGVEWGLDGTS